MASSGSATALFVGADASIIPPRSTRVRGLLVITSRVRTPLVEVARATNIRVEVSRAANLKVEE